MKKVNSKKLFCFFILILCIAAVFVIWTKFFVPKEKKTANEEWTPRDQYIHILQKSGSLAVHNDTKCPSQYLFARYVIKEKMFPEIGSDEDIQLLHTVDVGDLVIYDEYLKLYLEFYHLALPGNVLLNEYEEKLVEQNSDFTVEDLYEEYLTIDSVEELKDSDPIKMVYMCGDKGGYSNFELYTVDLGKAYDDYYDMNQKGINGKEKYQLTAGDCRELQDWAFEHMDKERYPYLGLYAEE